MPTQILRRSFVAAIACLVVPAVARAQRPTRDSTTVSRDSSKRATSLDPVRITGKSALHAAGYAAVVNSSATKTPTALIDVPQSITIIGHELMTDVNMQGMSDVVRFVPGIVMAQGEGNRDQPTIRGNSTSSDLYIDGIRDDIQFFRDLYNIERVDAVTGASAMIFGRGSGGVLNRVTKQPVWTPVHELTLQSGSFANRRAMMDAGGAASDAVAVRLNGMYENSGSYRDDFRLERYGINPALTYSTPGANPLIVTASYEHFNDHRTADRGVPSFNGLPYNADASTFFGNPRASYANATVDAGTFTLARTTASGLTIRNHSRWSSYDKVYQNVFPGGAVNPAGTQVSLSAYNNAARRHNLFNQTDLTYSANTGAVRHTLLVGAELGRQSTANFRNTGYFNNTATSFAVSVTNPNVDVPVTFRQSATDADNFNAVIANSVYAQDQIALTSHLQFIGGVRLQSFDINYHNNRGDTTNTRADRLVSPRAGVVFKPVDGVSFYSSYSVSLLPSSGDQFSSLTSVTKSLEPEKFTNVEAGAKWQATDRLALTGAVYRLERTNTRAADPTDPTRFVQTGESRTNGIELSAFGNVTNHWEIAGTYTNQTARIMSQTAAAAVGATPAIVPHTVASLWNKLQLNARVGLGFGALRQSDMYAAVDNKVALRGFTRFDAAAFFTLLRRTRAQVNLENLFDNNYFVTADNDNNITPGAPRTVRVSLIVGF